jgi:YHS domain-containing protein
VAKAVLLVFALFMLLTVLRGLRIFFNAARSAGQAFRGRRTPAPREEEMVRDPVCGTWIDRKLALPVERGGETIAVCSRECQRSLEAAR